MFNLKADFGLLFSSLIFFGEPKFPTLRRRS